MLALFYQVHPVGWATCKWLHYFWPGCLVSRLNGLTLRRAEPPALPGDAWVRVRTLMAGICGSDVGLIRQNQPPDSILQAFTSMPMGMGHENLGVVQDVGPAVDESWQGRRVCVEPTLCCAVRGIDPPCRQCAAGQFSACENFAAADGRGRWSLPPGMSIGFNSRTGGSFGECFVAHESQLVAVPDGLSDERAILTDPVACSLHAALRADLKSARRVLIYGAGVLGLGLIACLRTLGFAGQIDALGRSGRLAELARSFGATEFLSLPAGRKERFGRIAERTAATVQRVRFGNYMLSGGYDVVFDCAGSRQSVEESLKWAAARGQVVIVATTSGGSIDWTPVWFRELTVLGAYGRQMEFHAGKRVETYQLVHELMEAGRLDVEDMLTHTFHLKQYKRAFQVALNKGRNGAIKVAFDFR